MARVENIERLNTATTTLWSGDYLSNYPLINNITSAVSNFAHGKVLDIGCGNKPYKNLFLPNCKEYLGCDIVQSSSKCVDIICEANNIPIESETMDTVFSSQVIEHVADFQGMLKESFRVLKVNGNLIISGPMYWPLHEEPYDFFRFTTHGFKHIMLEAGFQKIEINPCGGKWSFVGLVILHTIPYRPRIISRILNPLFAWLDRRFPDYTITFNYVVTARKI